MGKNSIMKKVLITGGAGFIGSNLALYLIKNGHEVTVLDNLSPQIHGEVPILTSQLYKSIIGKVSFIKGTVTSKADWEKALDGQDVIVHLAAETGTGQSMYCIEKYVNVNINGTLLLYASINVLATVSTSMAFPVPTLNTCPFASSITTPRKVALTTSSIKTKSLDSAPSSKI